MDKHPISPVLELQDLATSSTSPTTEVLRRALVVATKLGLDDAVAWIDCELGGYQEIAVPNYRVIQSELVAQHTSGYLPLLFQDPKQTAGLREMRLHEPVGQLDDMASSKKASIYPFPLSVEQTLIEHIDSPVRPLRRVGWQQLRGVVEAVKDAVLRWSLQLEKEGILGENLRFSLEERERASTSQQIHIESFQGVLGAVSDSTVLVGRYATISHQLEQTGLPKDDREELRRILSELGTSDTADQPDVLKRGLAWVLKHSKALGALSATIQAWFV